jgi:hypothetical protein
MIKKIFAYSVALASIIGIAGGCSSSGGGAPMIARDTTPPVITAFEISPPSAGWRAGLCGIHITATDSTSSVESVTARITGPGSDGEAITLTPMLGAPGTYMGTGLVPANTNSDGTANSYFVTAWAQDPSGNSTTVAESLSFTVPAPDGPLPPPSSW